MVRLRSRRPTRLDSDREKVAKPPREPLITDVVGAIVGGVGVLGIYLKGFQWFDLVFPLFLVICGVRFVQGFRAGEPWMPPDQP